MPVYSYPVASHTLLILGCILLLFSAWKAVRARKNLMALLGWMSLADVSFVALGFACDGAGGATAAILLMTYNGIARLLAWFCLNRLQGAAHSFSPDAMAGVGRSMPVTAALYAFSMFAALGISPFLTPDAKPFALHAVMAADQAIVPAVMVLVNAVMAVLTVLAVHGVWLGGGSYPDGKESLKNMGLQLPLCLAAALAAMGIFSHTTIGLAASLAGELPALLPDFALNWRSATFIAYSGAFVTWLAGRFRPTLMRPLPAVFLALAFAAALADNSCGPLGRLFAIVCTGIGFLVTVYSIGYVHHPEKGSPYAENRYFFFLLILFGSLAGIAQSTNLGSLFVFWELMTFSSYVLVAHENTRAAHAAALKYFIMCAVASAVMLPGLLLLSTQFGSLEYAALSGRALSLSPGMVLTILCLVLVGFGVKAGLVPGHSWLPDAHPAAPSSISAPLSGVMTKAGVFGLFQFLFVIFGVGLLAPNVYSQSAQISQVLGMGKLITALGVITMLYGEIMALRQTDLKRILAYSTMGQVGEITLTLGLCSYLAATGALFHLVNHAVMKDLLFLCSGVLILRSGSRELKDLRGLGRAMPFTATCMVIGLLAIMGLPPFSGFMSKYMMLYAIADQSPMLAGLMLLASMAGCIYYMRIIRTLIFEPYEGQPLPNYSMGKNLSMLAPLGILAGLCVLMGLFPNIGLALVLPAVKAFVQAGHLPMQQLPSLSICWPWHSLLLLVGAIVPVLLRANHERAGKATGLILALAALVVLATGRQLDSLSFWFAFLVPAMGSLNMFYASGYMAHSHTQWRFYTFFLLMCAGLTGVAVSQDLFNFFLFWEIMSSWSLYFVIVHEENAAALREGFKYFFFNMLGAAFLFLGVVLLVNWSGSAAFSDIRLALPKLSSGQIALSLSLMAIGFIMKAAQLPFRIDIQMHPATAPTPVSGYISAVLLKSALFGLAKLFFVLGGGIALAGAGAWLGKPEIMGICLWIGGITIVMAAAYAVFQSDIKLVLIYSTVSQLGYMVVGIALGTSLGVAGGLLHLVNHMFFKDLLFLVAGALIVRTHRQSMNEMGGIGARMPITLAFFTIGALCVIGVPPSNGFTSKWIIYHALMEQGEVLLAIMSLAGSVLTLAYFAKMLHLAFLGQPAPGMDKVTEAPRSMLVPMGVLAGLCVLTSIFPGLALKPINAILAQMALPALDVAPWGIASGSGAWNATVTSVLFLVAGFGAWKLLMRSTGNVRDTTVHTCGVDVEELNLHTTGRDIYTAPEDALKGFGRNAVSLFGKISSGLSARIAGLPARLRKK